MSADALSDVLRTVRLTGAAFFDIVATAPWVAEQPPRENILPKILPGAGHLIAYHVVTEGRCFTNLIGEEPVEVEAGEVIVFTKGDQHVLSSSPGMRADPGAPSAHDAVPGSQLPFLINLGGDEDRPRPSSSAASLPAMHSRSIRCSTICRRSSRPPSRKVAIKAGLASSSAWR